MGGGTRVNVFCVQHSALLKSPVALGLPVSVAAGAFHEALRIRKMTSQRDEQGDELLGRARSICYLHHYRW
jgi:hypothetical protein